ncbi:hypothetical protein PRIC2_013535 [Phytophthora ramorum]
MASTNLVYRISDRTSHHNLKAQIEPLPTVRDHEVLVEIRGVTLNARDLQICSGLYPAAAVKDDLVPCSDGAGVIAAVGPAVDDIHVGDRVIVNIALDNLYGPLKSQDHMLGGGVDGTLRQYAAVPALAITKVPEECKLDYVQLASLVCTGATVWNSLYGYVPMKPGQAVLFQGTGASDAMAEYPDEAAPIDPEGPGPTRIVYKMFRAHKPQYWRNIRLVAKYKYRHVPQQQLRTKHAAFAWCPQCEEEMACRVGGGSAVRRHMELYHARELQEYEAARITQTAPPRGTVRPRVPEFHEAEGEQPAATQKQRGTVRPLASEVYGAEGEQPAVKKTKTFTNEQKRQVNKLVAQWIAVNRRPPAMVDDPGFRRLIEIITDLAALELHLPGRTQVRDDVMRIAEEGACCESRMQS